MTDDKDGQIASLHNGLRAALEVAAEITDRLIAADTRAADLDNFTQSLNTTVIRQAILIQTLEAQIAAMTASAAENAEMMQPMHEQAMAQAIRIAELEDALRVIQNPHWCQRAQDAEDQRDRVIQERDVAEDRLVALRAWIKAHVPNPFDHNAECTFCDEQGQHDPTCPFFTDEDAR